MTQEAIAVLGAGSWGTAMAIMMARSGHPVTLWGHDPEHIQQLRTDQSNRTFLPGTDFPANLLVTDDLEKTVSSHTFLMLAVPSHAFRETLLKCKPHLQPGSPACIAYAERRRPPLPADPAWRQGPRL